MKNLISFIALLCCISANAAECNREIQVVQTKYSYNYREWQIGEDVDFFIGESTRVIRYTQRGNFNIKIFNQAMETVSLKNALGTTIYVDTDPMDIQIILYGIENKSIDECPPGFSPEAIKDMPKRKFIVVGDYSGEKPKKELTEARLARVIDRAINPKCVSIQKIDPSVNPTHYTAILEPEERIFDGEAADKAENVRGKTKSGDGRLHIFGCTFSMTQRTDGRNFSSKSSTHSSINMYRSMKSSHHSSHTLFGKSSDSSSDDE